MAARDEPEMMDFTADPKSDYCTTRMATMWQHQQDGIFTDFVIKVKDKSIPCHKVVLSASCDYFETALTSKFKECESEICMEGMDGDLMTNILKYLYGQKASFSMKSPASVCDAIERLKLTDLKNQVEEFLCEHLSLECSLNLWKLSSKYRMVNLSRTSTQWISANIIDIGGTEEFKQLNIEELLRLITDEDLEQESHDELLIGCIEWVDYEPLARKEYVLEIMKRMNIHNCSMKMLKTITKKYQDLIHDPNVYSVILNDVFEKVTPNPNLVILGGMENNWDGNINRKCFVSQTFHWEEFAEIPDKFIAKRSPIICLEDGFVVLCGGNEHNKTAKYDTVNKAWAELPASPVSLTNASAVTCNYSVYLLGGDGPLDSVYRLDIASLTWHKESNMLEKQQWPISASLNTTIFVVYSAANGKKAHYSLQAYDSATSKSWNYKCGLPAGTPSTHGAAMTEVGGDSLYIVGGLHEDEGRFTAQYSVAADEWTALSPPGLLHDSAALAHTGGRLYVIGHANTEHSQASVYDIENRQWSVVPLNLPFKQVSFCKVAFVSWL